MKILYFDCFAGISGDMTVGALLDLGVPLDVVRKELARLPLPLSSYTLSGEKTSRKGIRASKFSVHVEEHQPHRHYTDISGMIEQSSLAEGVKEKAQRILFRLAEAESKVHGVEIGHVHFHEVGGLDSIVDIVGTAICIEYLGIDEIHVSPLPLGSGYVETAHGRLPVPAPATAELLRGIPVHGKLGEGERVTPTGAAIVAALGTAFGGGPSMTIASTGYGAGDKDFDDVPNILRVMLGEKTTAPLLRDEIMVVETHIDDMNPEILGFLMERLLACWGTGRNLFATANEKESSRHKAHHPFRAIPAGCPGPNHNARVHRHRCPLLSGRQDEIGSVSGRKGYQPRPGPGQGGQGRGCPAAGCARV